MKPFQARWLWLAVAILLLLVLFFYARLVIVEPIQNWQADDLAIDYSAATVLRSGGFIYAVIAAAAVLKISPILLRGRVLRLLCVGELPSPLNFGGLVTAYASKA